MKSLRFLLAFVFLAVGCSPPKPIAGAKLYLQLVRGDNQDLPPTPEAKPIGSKLSKRLHSVYRWKNYWELKRECVLVQEGQCVRKRLCPEREVEIELLGSRRMAARLFVNGKLSRTLSQAAKGAFYVAGGEDGESQAWFIVVREDPPLEPEA